jgi:hypothetical protein
MSRTKDAAPRPRRKEPAETGTRVSPTNPAARGAVAGFHHLDHCGGNGSRLIKKKKNGCRLSLLELELVLAVVGAIAARAAIDLHEKLAAAPSTCAAALPPLHC